MQNPKESKMLYKSSSKQKTDSDCTLILYSIKKTSVDGIVFC
jgi:hypothetical protein